MRFHVHALCPAQPINHGQNLTPQVTFIKATDVLLRGKLHDEVRPIPKDVIDKAPRRSAQSSGVAVQVLHGLAQPRIHVRL
jgi:hypothetical protein